MPPLGEGGREVPCIYVLGVFHILRNQQRGRGFPNAYGGGQALIS